MCNCNKTSTPAQHIGVMLAACDLDGPADSSCCVPDDTPDCGQLLAQSAAEAVRRCRPPVIFTPTPSPTPTPGPWTPSPGVPTPGAGCKPGEVFVQADNSLGIPAGCYPNDIARRNCKPVIPPWPGHHGGVDACFDGQGRVTAFVERPAVQDPF